MHELQQARYIKRVKNLLTPLFITNNAGLLQHCEVLGDGGEIGIHRIHEFTDALLAFRQFFHMGER